jgi:N-formylglutamate deformylase
VPPPTDRRPVLAHIPHAATRIPPDVRADIAIDDAALDRELIRLTDWHTDDLFAWLADHGATRFVNRVSRLVVDPERFSDPEREPTEATGHGVVYTRTTDGRRLRDADPRTRDDLVERFYRPYHAALDAVAAELVATFGRCTLVDCHSFPSDPLPFDLDRSAERPDICLGRDSLHTPESLAESLADAFRAEGFTVAFDRPYSGSMVPSAYHGDRRLRSVMIEVRRDAYLNEATGEPSAGYAVLKSALERAVVASGALD